MTGVLASQPRALDVQIDNFSLQYMGHELITDSRLELNRGRRYGLIGPNGSGKSVLLKCLGAREVPIPDHISIHLLSSEVPPSERTALQAVIDDVDAARAHLEAEAERLLSDDGPDSDRLQDVYERLDLLDADTAAARAGAILHGLGFTSAMQSTPTKAFSGGWRMRVALSRALFMRPSLLLLDEPTNHLDLEACVWLEEHLRSYNQCLVVISHSQDFLNGVCTNIIHLHRGRLVYYSGNYDAYVRTRASLEENQMKRYQWEQDQIAHMKDYIARFGHGSAKLARQAQSKEKVLAKMEAAGLAEKVVADKTLSFRFADAGKLAPPVLCFFDVDFCYAGRSANLYSRINLSIDLDSRIALVGPNGAGKSTLLKLMAGELAPTSGMVRHNTHLRIARFHQHLAEQLDAGLTPLQYMMRMFPEIVEVQEMRAIIGRFGLTGQQQVTPVGGRAAAHQPAQSAMAGGARRAAVSAPRLSSRQSCAAHGPPACRWANCRMDNGAVLYLRGWRGRCRISCFSTSPQTTWTLRPSIHLPTPSTVRCRMRPLVRRATR